MSIMDPEVKQESTPPLPVLPRLDRLDRLLQLLEEKHSSSGRHLSGTVVKNVEQEDQCRPLSSALEEVHHKGTLIERLAMLENRVLQLSLEMDEGNTSNSSSSTFPASTVRGQDEEEIRNPESRNDPVVVQEEAPGETTLLPVTPGTQNRRQKRKRLRKWLGLFRLGCS